MLQKRLQLPEILSTERAVDDSVIAGERGGHHWASHDLSIANDGPLGNGANRDNGGLRWVDHRHEPIDAKHSQIGDCDRSTRVFLGFERSFSSSRGEIPRLGGES